MPAEIIVKSVLNKTKHRDPWFLDDYTVNPYSGCSFNCLFCYIRGSKYGEHMERKLAVKSNLLEVLDKQLALRARKNQYGFIVVSSATDPYLHVEQEERLTRGILELILKYRFPVHIITRSDLVLRDLDLLERINREGILPQDLHGRLTQKALVSFSFSTLDQGVADIFEPGATPLQNRLNTLKEVLAAGLKSGVSLMPLLPYISDKGEDLENYFSTFAGMKVHYLMPAGLTLFGRDNSDNKTLVFRAVERHYPELLPKYQRLFSLGSELPAYYRKAFSLRMAGLAETYHIPARIV